MAPPWHAEARLLREQGCTIDRLAETFDRDPSSIRRVVVSGAREQQNACRRRLYHKRAADPEFRRKEADRIRAYRLALKAAAKVTHPQPHHLALGWDERASEE